MKHPFIFQHSALQALRRSPFLRIPLLSLLLTLLIELLNHRCFNVGFGPFFHFFLYHTWAFLVCYLLVTMTMLPAVFFRRRVFYCLLLTVFWLTVGFINGYIQLKRSAPFTAPDLSELRAGIDTLPNYVPVFGIVLMVIAAVGLLVFLGLFFLKGPQDPHPIEQRMTRGICAILVCALCLAGSWTMGFAHNQLSKTFSNLTYAYNDYGFVYCFLQTWLNRGIRKPDSYTRGAMREIRDEVEETAAEAAEVSEEPDVNILFVQLESLLDPDEVSGLTLSEDPCPNLHALQCSNSSGYLLVPVVGAGTANTEFEVLTGMSCRFFGPGEYAYKAKAQYQTIDSLAYTLSDLGYRTHAVHNNRATFYNRDVVFSNLGFDDFTSLEYMPETAKTPNNWCEDSVLTSQILSAMDETENASDFVYTITVQCHGSYSADLDQDPAILVEACPENIDHDSMEYYVNQLAGTDAFVGDLIAQLEARDEKTVVVFFGDHLPSLNLEASQLKSSTLFRTNYVIWDNFSLPKERENLCAYELSTEVLNRIGLQGGFMNQFHTARKESSSYQAELKAVQYDLLYGKNYLNLPVRTATDLQLGVTKAAIQGIVRGNDCFYVLGRDFTPYYHVSSGEDVLDTTYLGANLLRVDENPDETDLSGLTLTVIDSHKENLGDAPYDFDY